MQLLHMLTQLSLKYFADQFVLFHTLPNQLCSTSKKYIYAKDMYLKD